MNWRIAAASVAGTAHRQAGSGCQDSCWAQSTLEPLQCLVILAADGAGGALFGGDGAELAIQAAAQFIAEISSLSELALDDSLAIECTAAVRGRLADEATCLGRSVRDYACTFLGAVCSSNETLVWQIGDGAFVLDAGNGLEVPVAPQAGEYANLTRFITDDDALVRLAVRHYSQPATKIAAFTDGVQRLALNLATNMPHEPFFAPLFASLADTAPEQDDQLHAALVNFLDSPAVNERTDDDKTLALAINVP